MTKRELELKGQGWERRSVTDDYRVSDLVATYESIGFECLVEPLPPREQAEEAGDCGECRICFEDERMTARYKVIYTRKK
jgi:hypothetical protein